MAELRTFWKLSMKHLSFPAIFITGFASSLGQILVLRELLIIFYGNELSTGLIFTAWLVWTAIGSGIGGRNKFRQLFPSSPYLLAITLIIFSFLLPVTLIWIRASKILWNIAPGEILSLSKMFFISFSVTGPFCLFSGLLFSMTWAFYTTEDLRGFRNPAGLLYINPIIIYLFESVGAASGGIIFYFFLLISKDTKFCVSASALITSAGILIIAAVLLLHEKKRKISGYFCWLFTSVIIITALFFHSPLDHLTRKWQWGEHLITVVDTPFQNLSLVKDKDLFTLFANGLWSFSSPDPQSAEKSVHPALLQHPNPQNIMLIGGGVAGLLNEILKHPQIKHVDYIEPDPELIRLAEKYLPKSETAILYSDIVHLFYEDAGAFIRQTDRLYDIILMNVGDPVNAQMNRFYTKEFYHEIKKHLKDSEESSGIFSFFVSSAPDMLGPAQIKFLQSVYKTLLSVFPQVVIYPGDYAGFFATGRHGNLITDPDELISRIADRNLNLRYIREYYLFDMLNPMRLDYFNTILSDSGSQSPEMINRNFKPTCYFYSLVLWSAQIHKGFKDFLIWLSNISPLWLWTGLFIIIFTMIITFSVGDCKPERAIGLNVMIVGGMQITMEIIILLGFQIIAGFVYMQLAVIIALFMAGLGLGAGITANKLSFLSRLEDLMRCLILVQTIFSLYMVAMIGILFLLQDVMQKNIILFSPCLIFSVLAFIAGILGGSHFSLAVKAVSGLVSTGGGLYALDLIGSAVGALTASLFLLPIYGLVSTLIFFSLLGIGGAITLVCPLHGFYIRKGLNR